MRYVLVRTKPTFKLNPRLKGMQAAFSGWWGAKVQWALDKWGEMRAERGVGIGRAAQPNELIGGRESGGH